MDKGLQRQLRLFYAYRFISRFYMYLPILAIIFVRAMNLSYFACGVILAVHGLSILLLKAPTAWIPRRFSQKGTLILGEICKSLGVLCLAISNGAIAILVLGQVFSGLGFSLTSSTEATLLQQVLEERGAGASFRGLLSKSQSYIFVSVLISGVIGSVLAVNSLLLPLYLSIPASLLAACCIAFLQVKPQTVSTPVEQSKEVRPWREIGQALPIELFYAINRAAILTIFVLVLPLLLFTSSNVNLAFFGLILSCFSLPGFLLGNYLERLSKLVGEATLWVAVPITLLLCIALSLVHVDVLLVIVPALAGIAIALVRPLTMAKMSSVAQQHRAEVISFSEMLFGLFNAIFLLIVAYLLKYSIDTALYIIAGILLAINILLGLHWGFSRLSLSKQEQNKHQKIS